MAAKSSTQIALEGAKWERYVPKSRADLVKPALTRGDAMDKCNKINNKMKIQGSKGEKDWQKTGKINAIQQ